MFQIGRKNTLTVVKHVDFGVYLDGRDELGEILLPKRYVPDTLQDGDEIEVFLYHDSEDRLIATTDEPLAQIGDFAAMRVKQITSVGAFLEWGIMKDLLVPFSEQKHDLREGETVFVYVYQDSVTSRIVASAKWEKFCEKDNLTEIHEGDAVSLQIASKTPLGYKALINSRYVGLVYADEIFSAVNIGDRVGGFIRKIRPDGKIDLSLKALGYAKVKGESEMLLSKLRAAGGFIATTDKSPAELIYETYGISKKCYKQAVGDLYKRGLIDLESNGIKLRQK